MSSNALTLHSFAELTGAIQRVHDELAAQASRAVNISLTLRNWLIGCHIEEYERIGKDRAEYGERLMDALAAELTALGVTRCDRRELYRYRQFYLTYPQIVEALTPQLEPFLSSRSRQHEAAVESTGIPIVESATPKSQIDGKTLATKLSFTHIVELIAIDDDTKRAFYEIECIRGNWSVRELKRQIGSLYYERSGLSRNKGKLSKLANQAAEQAIPHLAIRDPYIFEFLGLRPKEVMGESHLEDQLIDKLEEFLLELGHGFCFEARQKRILIGDEYFFIDLVFYHRLLKCHVLVELKLEKFSQENIGQLNTYVSWYRKNMMAEGDNPPIGILLCTDKNHALAEYALAGLDNNLFVSKYLLELPKKEEMQRFIDEQLRQVQP
ncbi:MAG: PDDEXK nuclease domain-containing protein [Desulfoprunum sp.]|nr:PDDEXK nuclease domain-containing protein [Desulfoprunum sp.]